VRDGRQDSNRNERKTAIPGEESLTKEPRAVNEKKSVGSASHRGENPPVPSRATAGFREELVQNQKKKKTWYPFKVLEFCDKPSRADPDPSSLGQKPW